MSRQAGMFEATGGSVVEAFFLLRTRGANIPIPLAWIERARHSRKSREKELGTAVKAGDLDALVLLRD